MLDETVSPWVTFERDVNLAVGLLIDADRADADCPEDGVEVGELPANGGIVEVVPVNRGFDLAGRDAFLHARGDSPRDNADGPDIGIGERRLEDAVPGRAAGTEDGDRGQRRPGSRRFRHRLVQRGDADRERGPSERQQDQRRQQDGSESRELHGQG